MDPLVSIVVPVRNAQATLPAQIAELLEVMSDLAASFQVVVVDDGSTDETVEIARELARRFPQVQLAQHDQNRTGRETAVMTGLAAATGEVVFMLEAPSQMSVNRLQQLWHLRDDDQLVMAHTDNASFGHQSGVIRRLLAWGQAQKGSSSDRGAVQMIRRQAIGHWGAANRKLLLDPGQPSQRSRPLATRADHWILAPKHS